MGAPRQTRRYRKVIPVIWGDQAFCSLNDRGKLLFLYILTHPYLTSLGTLVATAQSLAADRGWRTSDVTRLLQKMEAVDMLCMDRTAGLIWLPNYLKHNKPESPNVIRHWPYALDQIPECSLKHTILKASKSYVTHHLGEGFREAYAQALGKAHADALRHTRTRTRVRRRESKASPGSLKAARAVENQPGHAAPDPFPDLPASDQRPDLTKASLGKIDTSREAIRTAADWRHHLIQRPEIGADQRKTLLMMTPVGCFRDTGKPLYEADPAQRDQIKSTISRAFKDPHLAGSVVIRVRDLKEA